MNATDPPPPGHAFTVRAKVQRLLDTITAPFGDAQRYAWAATIGAYEDTQGRTVTETGTAWIGTLPTPAIPELRHSLARLARDLQQESIGLIIQPDTDTLIYAAPDPERA